jgi:hypothetical protein
MSKFSRSPYRVSVAGGRVVVQVTFNKEWQEFRARITVDGITNKDADSFDDDSEAIEATAHAMAKHAAAALKPLVVQDNTRFSADANKGA